MGGPSLKSSFQDLGPQHCEEHMKTHELENGGTRCTHHTRKLQCVSLGRNTLRVVSVVQNDLGSSSMQSVCPDCTGVEALSVICEERRSVRRDLEGEAAWAGLDNSLGSLHRTLVSGNRTMTTPGRGS